MTKKIINTIVTIEPPRYKKDTTQCIQCQHVCSHIIIWSHKRLLQQKPGVRQMCRKSRNNNLTRNKTYAGKIDEVKCYNRNGNHPVTYKGYEVRKQLQRKLFPSLRSRTYSNYPSQQEIAEPGSHSTWFSTPNVQNVSNFNHRNINTIGSRSYAQITNQILPLNNQNQNGNNNNATEIKELFFPFS